MFIFQTMRLFALLLLCTVAWAQERKYVNAQLGWHSAVVDKQGKLLAWYEPEKNLGYDKVLHLGWDFIEHKVPKDTRGKTGQKIYLVNSVFDSKTLQGINWQHNPAMVYAAFVDGVVAWYAYSGDSEAVATVREMLDYQLAHGTTPLDWKWPGVPFATACENDAEYGHCIQNLPREFYGGIESDKVGQLGTGYALFYELTGDRKYLDAAIRCADALAGHVRAGDQNHTPWPFRIDGKTGITLTHEEYGGETSAALRLFDELIRLQSGNVVEYKTARDTAWNWMLHYPLNQGNEAWDKWAGFFEDVPYRPTNVNQFLPDMTAYYIMSRPDPAEVDPEWSRHVGHLIDWVRRHFGRGPFLGAWAIDEQGQPERDYYGCCSRAGEGSHGGRWAAINAIYAGLTGDEQAREDAFRSMNYTTYFADSDGKIACCGVDYHHPYWFSDGYADYLRHLNWIMGALPDLAPVGEDHILHSTSVVQKVAYKEGQLSYRTFDDSGTEVLRLKYKPTRITAGVSQLTVLEKPGQAGYTIRQAASGDYIIEVRRERARDVAIEGS
ncbi:MAG TPA: hypothetical protein VH601_07615 [Bryobacteraceae bacterium]|jgi:hypothetical protein